MAHLITTKGLMIVGGKAPKKKKKTVKPKKLDMTADWSKGIVYK